MFTSLLLTSLMQVAPAPAAPAAPAAAPAPQPSTKVNEVRPRLWTSGLLTYESLTGLKKLGVGTVLHLRPEKEAPSLPATERVAVEGMGLRYIHSPVTPSFEDEEFDAFRKQMKGVDRDKGVLIHCFNGNRASASLLTWFVLDEKMPLDQALALAKKGGLTMIKAENAARFYISRNGGPAYVEQADPKPAAH
ncbi:MAG TPA: sulfur transferase domain-containing protein [Holophaga sp.]|nr:sulfur transferase domain-containing protein [Holophaga sp.]